MAAGKLGLELDHDISCPVDLNGQISAKHKSPTRNPVSVTFHFYLRTYEGSTVQLNYKLTCIVSVLSPTTMSHWWSRGYASRHSGISWLCNFRLATSWLLNSLINLLCMKVKSKHIKQSLFFKITHYQSKPINKITYSSMCCFEGNWAHFKYPWCYEIHSWGF